VTTNAQKHFARFPEGASALKCPLAHVWGHPFPGEAKSHLSGYCITVIDTCSVYLFCYYEEREGDGREGKRKGRGEQ